CSRMASRDPRYIFQNPPYYSTQIVDPYYNFAAWQPEPVREQTRTVFVGYPYKLPKDDYRAVFADVGEEYRVSCGFGDDELTSEHILEKIAGMIAAADFSLFDITYWNPNVALELGIAYGRGLDFYILFDPTKEEEEVLADLRGIDRIEYTSY